ncbi:GNAT family N-acetyltransferase [Clostridium perfringens]|uniref:GNAT family N-acetyltransferase n=1 Tax=Clostridium perfringens TaxID=1502 RepID=UPI0028CD9B25|nr:GNAT family N-acetyltransferase [Clostridium perfringens]MDT7975435.1 GNAT family N-acetyltransferase [Clostridium perfringens]
MGGFDKSCRRWTFYNLYSRYFNITKIYIQDILILQKYQNRGIGKRLIEIILDKYKNVRQKVLLTDKEEKNILFYKKVGFSMAEEFGCVSFVKF